MLAKTTIAYVSLIPLTATAFGSTYTLLSSVATEEIQQLAGKDVTYWLIALSFGCVSAAACVVRWLVTQLEKQREATAEERKLAISAASEERKIQNSLQEKLLNYLQDGHAAMLTTIAQNNELYMKMLQRMNIAAAAMEDKVSKKIGGHEHET